MGIYHAVLTFVQIFLYRKYQVGLNTLPGIGKYRSVFT